MENYEILEEIGRGTYGTVLKARKRGQRQLVALKMVEVDDADEGISSSTLREVCLLRELQHRNIVNIKDFIITDTVLTLVFEYCDLDMKKYLNSLNGVIDHEIVKSLMFQFLEGLAYCHSNDILHRDLKPANLLLNKKGELKIADFGLARVLNVPAQPYSTDVVTLWYRPPDVLMGSSVYNKSLDMWSAGCIFAELANTGQVLFPGVNEEHQLSTIFWFLGTPNEEAWPDVIELPKYRRTRHSRGLTIAEIVPRLSPRGRHLLQRLLVCNPSQRMGVEDALVHPYFENVKIKPLVY